MNVDNLLLLNSKNHMDNILIITVAIIFFTALLSRLVQKNDRVLKSIRNFHVTVVLKGGKEMWGKAHMYVNGMKLLFSKPYQSSGGSWVESYLFYQTDMNNMHVIYRYQDELSPKNRRRRALEVTRVSAPSYWRKFMRQLRNFISNFQEAFSETLGVLLNRFKSSTGDLIKANEKHLKLVGSTAIGAAGKEYDQMLEHHINQKVVVAVDVANETQEYTGFLGEYSAQWLALMDCQIEKDWHLPLNDINKLVLNRDIDVGFKVTNKEGCFQLTIELINHGQKPVEIKRLEGKDFSQKIHRIIASSSTEIIHFDDVPVHILPNQCEQIIGQNIKNIAPERGGQYHADLWKENRDQLPACALIYSANRRLDVYVPRRIATVRHGVCLN